ncbi:MAG: dTDP-4-keto-6-deoxy-D-glucose epimerase, partial [Deltaproteobacteria bacterium]
PGAFLIELEPFHDERGSFARTFCAREFEAHGLDPRVVQCNLSQNELRGTLRGMHAQRPPHAEAKLVSCVRGAIH